MTSPHRSASYALLSVMLASVTASSCFGFAEVARGSLLLQTNLSATYDSYFIGTEDNAPDYIYVVYPSLRYTREAGRARFSGAAGHAYNWYQRNSDLDSRDLRFDFSVQLPVAPGSRLDGGFSVNYAEATVVDYQVFDRVVTNTFNTGLNLNYQLSERMQLGETLSYNNTVREMYSDQESLTNTLDYTYNQFLRGTSLIASHTLTITNSSGYAFVDPDNPGVPSSVDTPNGVLTATPPIDQWTQEISIGLARPLYGEVTGRLSYGYSFMHRSSDETAGGDTDSAYGSINLGLDGPFLPQRYFPKLQSSFSISYSQPATLGLGDEGGRFLSGSLGLSWQARERTSLYFNASRSIELSANDMSVETNRVNGGFTQQIGRSNQLGGFVGYSWNTWRGVDRSDSIFDAGLSLSRSFNKYLGASIGYTYMYNQSDASGPQLTRYTPRNYERQTVTASANVTF